MGQHFLFEIRFVERVDGLARVEGDVFEIAEVAVGFVFEDFCVVGEAAVDRVRLAGLVEGFDDLGGGGVFPADGGGDLYFLSGVELEVGGLERGVVAVEVVLLGANEIGLELASFLENRELGAPSVGVEQVFDLLLFQLGEIGFEGGADLGLVVIKRAISSLALGGGCVVASRGAVGLVDRLSGHRRGRRGSCAAGSSERSG